MRPQSDTPKFPHVSGDLEDSAVAGRKGVFGKALFKTFVQPSVDQLSWKVKQFAPKQMAFNMLQSTPFGQKLIDLKGNYDFIKDPNHEGYNNTDVNVNTKGQGGQAGGSNQELRALVETLQAGMSTMTSELRNIKRSVDGLQRTNTVGTTEQSGTKSKVSELVELFKSFFMKDKYDQKEHNLSKDDEFAPTVKNKESKNWLADMLAALIKFRLAFIGGLGTLRLALTSGFAKLGTGIAKMFKAVRIPSLLIVSKSFDKISKFFSSIGTKLKIPALPNFSNLTQGFAKIGAVFGKLLGPFAKIGGKLARIGGRFAVITTVIMAAVDGIVGFFKGWGDTEGPIYKKFAAGFDGALQGIAKGLLEIPKMLLQALKFIGTSIVDMLGFKRLAASMRGFNLGEWWDKTIGGLVEKFDVAQSIVTIGERIVDIFLGLCEFIVKKLTGVSVNLRGNNRESSPDSNSRGSEAASSGADAGAAAAESRGATVREGAAATTRSGGGAATLGIRNNNPGNIRFNRGNNWVGQTGRGEGGQFSAFDTPENGVRAIGRLLQTYDRQGVNTLSGIARKWAPASDGNDEAAYIRTLQRATGLNATQKINMQDPATLQAIIRGIITQENGGAGSRITDAQVQAGVRAALGGRSVSEAKPNTAQAPRVDANTSRLQQAAVSVAASMLPAGIGAVAAPIINNMINNSRNNTIVPQRPPANNPSTSPNGPRT